jgi:hypothetical protein
MRQRYVRGRPFRFGAVIGCAAAACIATACSPTSAPSGPPTSTGQTAAPATQAVGPQYDSTHVYVDPNQLEAFVHSWTSTFGGTTTAAATTHVTPTPSTTRSQLILSPVGTLSVFGFLTPLPFPFGTERGGWLMSDLDTGLAHARAAGAVTVVAPFSDPIGRDTVIQFPGGVTTQLYWHTTAPSYPPLQTIPDNRVYLPPDAVDAFLKSYREFSAATVDFDDQGADGALLGMPGSTFREIHLSSLFGNTAVFVTNGQLPYPFGHEVSGYGVADVDTTIAKALAAGATLLSPPVGRQHSSMLQFPGGYIAEIHTARM